MRFAPTVAICLATTSIASAQVTVGALDSSRCRSLATAGNFGYTIITDALTAPSFQAATGFTITLASETPLLDAAYLAGVDVLFVGDGSGALSPSEATDLAAWHAAGGALFLIADSSTPGLADSCLAAIGSPYAYAGGSCGSGTVGNPVSSDDYVLTNGPFGDIRGQDLSTTPAAQLGSVAAIDVVVTCSDGSTIVAKHDAGDVNGASSGAVVMTGDASFIGLFTDPVNTSFFSQVNVDLALNAFVYLSGGGGGSTIGTNYCMANVNSTGVAASISATGSTAVADNDVTLSVTSLPADSFSLFQVSATQGFTPNFGGGEGNLCLGGTIGSYRTEVQDSGASGQVSLSLDLTAVPLASGTSVMVGDTYNWTCWFRDTASMGGGATTNFSDATSITFD
ncbi:MAG: hypothetical protein AAF957_03275 [Planctomycetota bacterium]